MRKLKVLVVDDSAFMRLLLTDILSADEGLDIIGTANDGREATEKVGKLKPDVVVLDMEMGEYDGIYAVRNIMAETPVPILILSAIGNTNLEPIFDALNLGAVDYMNKPVRSNSKMRTMELELINKIKSVGRAQPKVTTDKKNTSVSVSSRIKPSDRYDVIVIGASTGGPSAIEEIISAFPADINAPVIICQHMPANFIGPFVRRLNNLSSLDIVLEKKE